MNLTDAYLDDLLRLAAAPIPEHVRLQAKKCLLDYLGATLAGARVLAARSEQYLRHAGTGDTTVIGLKEQAALSDAALINGTHAHIIELDDGHRYCMVHNGAAIFSALLPIAQAEALSGEDFLRGVIIGYEAAVRLAKTVQPSHKRLGYHGTGTIGTIGAAMAVAAALRFTREEMKSALSAAVTSASGLLGIMADGADLKAYNAGKAAMNGIVSANMARVGYAGPSDIIGGHRGFLFTMSEQPALSELTQKAGAPYGIEGVYMKPYAACRYAHAPIQAALMVQAAHEIRHEDILLVRVSTYDYALPGHDHTAITGTTSAKMSIPYGVAVALVTGRAGLEEYLPAYVEDATILALTKKISAVADDKLTALTPHTRAAVVQIQTEHGTYSARVDVPKGEPENPLLAEDIENKFLGLAMYAGRSEQTAREMTRRIWDVENELPQLITMLHG